MVKLSLLTIIFRAKRFVMMPHGMEALENGHITEICKAQPCQRNSIKVQAQVNTLQILANCLFFLKTKTLKL